MRRRKGTSCRPRMVALDRESVEQSPKNTNHNLSKQPSLNKPSNKIYQTEFNSQNNDPNSNKSHKLGN